MDIDFLLWLQSIREGAAPFIKVFFTFLGSKGASVVLILVPCLIYWCVDKRRGAFAICAYGTSFLFNQLMKNTFCRYRPWVRDARIVPDPVAKAGATGYSFPSTHTQSTASILISLGWKWREKRWPLVCGIAFSLLTAFSRLFLGVHTPMDVLAAFAEGCLFIWVTERLIAWADEDEGRLTWLALASVLILIPYLAYITLKPYPMDYVGGELLVDPAEMMIDCYKATGAMAGISIGLIAERRLVRFETGGLTWRQVLARMVVGVVPVLIIYAPVGHALINIIGVLAGNFIRHLLAFAVALAGVPVCFERLDRLVEKRDRRSRHPRG